MKNNYFIQQNKIFDLKLIFLDLNQENKYKKLKQDFLTNLFENSIKIIKTYIQKLDYNINNNKNETKNIIYKNLLNSLNKEREKQKEDFYLLSIVVNSIKLKLIEINNDYIINPSREEKENLQTKRFILLNQIIEKNSIIEKMKKSYERLKELSFFQERIREIYLNNPLELKSNIFILQNEYNPSFIKTYSHRKTKSGFDIKKINKSIIKKQKLNIKNIKNAIKILDNEINKKKDIKYNTEIKNGYISKIHNERFNIIYKITIQNFDSDFSECSSSSRNFSFQDYFSDNEISSSNEYIKSEDYNKIFNNENENNSQFSFNDDDELSNLRKKLSIVKKDNHNYKIMINKLKSLIKKMKSHATKLKNIIRFSQKKCINNNLLNNLLKSDYI